MRHDLLAGVSLLAIFVAATDASAAPTFAYTGAIQTYVVPVTGEYDIIAAGGQGGGGFSGVVPGLGALIEGDVMLTAGTSLSIVVGGAGISGHGSITGGSGGGGSFVFSSSQLLAVAGGGGAAAISLGSGSPGLSGLGGSGQGGAGGTSPVANGGGGGGWLGNGAAGNGSDSGGGGFGPTTFAGGAGYPNGPFTSPNGAFGGGGGAGENGGGGGGGYSGGNGGNGVGGAYTGGGGGGSFLAPAFYNTTLTTGGATAGGDGYIDITLVPTTVDAPEPASALLLTAGLGGLGLLRRPRP